MRILLTMFTRQKGFLSEFGMGIVTGADNHQLNVGICKEVICGAIVLGVWMVDGAMLACRDI